MSTNRKLNAIKEQAVLLTSDPEFNMLGDTVVSMKI
ncbi:hypothetical protein B0F88_12132 [Methylobacter tundripaludum]|uniref:Uncharacterized protein n=1 Tax=Methylobacter tundripaludum TaxID=173365 RepID=A0A2S6GJD8_9GAMM|nr:hypothetical protein B0F88_12132 [Methylobacter tundripaludum]